MNGEPDRWAKRQNERIKNWGAFLAALIVVGGVVYQTTKNTMITLMGVVVVVLAFMVYDLYPRITKLERDIETLKGKKE